jgi:hypothetical protein
MFEGTAADSQRLRTTSHWFDMVFMLLCCRVVPHCYRDDCLSLSVCRWLGRVLLLLYCKVVPHCYGDDCVSSTLSRWLDVVILVTYRQVVPSMLQGRWFVTNLASMIRCGILTSILEGSTTTSMFTIVCLGPYFNGNSLMISASQLRSVGPYPSIVSRWQMIAFHCLCSMNISTLWNVNPMLQASFPTTIRRLPVELQRGLNKSCVIDSLTEADVVCALNIRACYFDTTSVPEMAGGVIIGTNARRCNLAPWSEYTGFPGLTGSQLHQDTRA